MIIRAHQPNVYALMGTLCFAHPTNFLLEVGWEEGTQPTASDDIYP